MYARLRREHSLEELYTAWKGAVTYIHLSGLPDV